MLIRELTHLYTKKVQCIYAVLRGICNGFSGAIITYKNNIKVLSIPLFFLAVCVSFYGSELIYNKVTAYQRGYFLLVADEKNIMEFSKRRIIHPDVSKYRYGYGFISFYAVTSKCGFYLLPNEMVLVCQKYMVGPST